MLSDVTLYATRGLQYVTLPSYTPNNATVTLTTSPSSSSFLSFSGGSSITITSTSTLDINDYIVTVVLTETSISSTFTFTLRMIADRFPYFKCPPESVFAVDNNALAPI